MSPVNKNMVTRAITGFFFVILLLFCINFNQYSSFLLFGGVSVIAWLEYARIVESTGASVQKTTGLLSVIILYLSTFLFSWAGIPGKYLQVNFLLLFLPIVIELFRNSKKPFNNISLTVFGIIYTSLPFSLLNLLNNKEGIFDPSIIMGSLIIIWSHDTGSYISGILFGKTKLFERVSPKKTWEGSAGGFIFALLAGYLLFYFKTSEISLVHWLGVALIIILAGTLGDLSESMLKRSAGIKDSGNILPGHGGVLDRFDSLMLSVPFIYVYLEIFTK